MKRILSSPRRRRRLVRAGVAASGVAALVVLGIRFSGGDGQRDLPPPRAGRPQLVAAAPRSVPLSKSDATTVRRVARVFVATAVLRHDVLRSWPLVAAPIRQNLTRSQWATGAIPVVPYSAQDLGLVKWRLTHSYRDRVGMRVLLEPKQGARSAAAEFDLELGLQRAAGKRRWLVMSWTPVAGELISTLPPGSHPAPAVMPKARLSAVWLVALVGVVLGLIVLIPSFLGVRGWLRHRRAARSYARSL